MVCRRLSIAHLPKHFQVERSLSYHPNYMTDQWDCRIYNGRLSGVYLEPKQTRKQKSSDGDERKSSKESSIAGRKYIWYDTHLSEGA